MQDCKIISLTQYCSAGAVAGYIRDCIRTGEMEKLSIKALCKAFATSETRLTRAFKQRHLITLHAFIVREKMNYARQLLNDDAHNSFTCIAIKLGYSELSNFSRDFTKATGCSPRAWKTGRASRQDHSG